MYYPNPVETALELLALEDAEDLTPLLNDLARYLSGTPNDDPWLGGMPEPLSP